MRGAAAGREAGLWVLRNGRYEVAVSRAGGGWSRFGDYALTAWSNDPTRDADGLFIYIRDLESWEVWSAALQPTLRTPERYATCPGRLPRITRDFDGIRTVLDVALAGDAAAELRRLTLTNRSPSARRLEVTTCVPLALDYPEAFAGHPAFSKLFIQTSYDPTLQGLIARRRPRSPDDCAVSAVHLLVRDYEEPGDPAFETDRAVFLGRGRTPASPRALDPVERLTGSIGNVLDPVLCLRRDVTLEPGQEASLTAVLAAGLDRGEAQATAARYASPGAARAAVDAARLAVDRLDEVSGREDAIPLILPGPPERRQRVAATPLRQASPALEEPLRFFNGYGGFNEAGDEYVIRLGSGPGTLDLPPLPWVNVVANEQIGFLASETGAGYTWCGNSRLNRLTPWSNDPVSDPHGEALYLRDEETGEFWSPLPGPAPGEGPYEARHGFGYSRYRHVGQGLEQDVWLFVAPEDPVKFARVRIANGGDRPRRLSAIGYVEWVLGATRPETAASLETEIRADLGAVLARNPASEDFRDHVAFAAAVPARAGDSIRATCGRAAFLGAYGDATAPAALRDATELPAGETRPDDACAALQLWLEVSPGETVECAFVLGQATSRDAALELIARYGRGGAAAGVLELANASWRRLLGGVSVRTPSPALDLMMNGWLTYQNVSCRLYGRSAFYQSGGAYGFRDQLQDATALVWLDPPQARRQVLRHAAHQFPEGDVLHWWHPPASCGIRTRFSDDLLWLPWVAGFYLDTTGDETVLDERTTFVLGRPLEPDEDEAYTRPERSAEDATVYEHCCRAIDRSLATGSHGLPLMGSGDWNDGMNRVGREGRGESVWLGFFLATVLDRWTPIARARGDNERAARYAAHRATLGEALNTAGWDGEWYRRAYYDDGAPVGSSESEECRIDAIAQAWAVISGVAPQERAERALDALEEHLVSEDEGLIRLLTPPFDCTPRDPGYIKGYLPGVRENGGQYTHGVLWAIRALAEAGRTERAAPLLEMLTPVMRAATRERADRYKVEPYVVAADVYGAPPHVGRGGWTWYTGSAAWMWRVSLESVLGVTLEAGERLRIRPRIPASWPGYRLDFRVPGGETRFEIDVRRAEGDALSTRATLDGEPLAVDADAAIVPLSWDGRAHRVVVELGCGAPPAQGGGALTGRGPLHSTR
jgi:N,N'-diacetylchitobiose phosphorylase